MQIFRNQQEVVADIRDLPGYASLSDTQKQAAHKLYQESFERYQEAKGLRLAAGMALHIVGQRMAEGFGVDKQADAPQAHHSVVTVPPAGVLDHDPLMAAIHDVLRSMSHQSNAADPEGETSEKIQDENKESKQGHLPESAGERQDRERLEEASLAAILKAKGFEKKGNLFTHKKLGTVKLRKRGYVYNDGSGKQNGLTPDELHLHLSAAHRKPVGAMTVSGPTKGPHRVRTHKN